MKKLLVYILVALCFVNSIEVIPVMAKSESQEGNVTQDEIDSLFDELNSLALQEHLFVSMSSNTKKQNQKGQIVDRKALIDARLEELGVHKIDPNNPDDLAYLAELPASNASAVPTGGVYDSAPDLSALALLYSIYVSDGTVNPFYNGSGDPGASYSYRQIRVIDDKGYNKLYNPQDVKMFESNNCTGNAFIQLLEYNFNFIISEFIGRLPKGMLINWSLGILDTINNLGSGNITTGNANYYGIQLDTLTEMTYYYMYYQGWKLIGVEAEAEYIRKDSFRGNVNGTPVNDTIYTEKNKLYSQNMSIRQYVANYITNMSLDSYYYTANLLGTLKIKGYDNKTYSFAPIFVRLPSHLI